MFVIFLLFFKHHYYTLLYFVYFEFRNVDSLTFVIFLLFFKEALLCSFLLRLFRVEERLLINFSQIECIGTDFKPSWCRVTVCVRYSRLIRLLKRSHVLFAFPLLFLSVIIWRSCSRAYRFFVWALSKIYIFASKYLSSAIVFVQLSILFLTLSAHPGARTSLKEYPWESRSGSRSFLRR